MSEAMDAWRAACDARLEAYKQLAEEAEPRSGPALVGWKPLKSMALKVHPNQIPEAMEKARARGVPTEFSAIGEPIFTSRSHRKAYLKYRGVVDRDGGYGDG